MFMTSHLQITTVLRINNIHSIIQSFNKHFKGVDGYLYIFVNMDVEIKGTVIIAMSNNKSNIAYPVAFIIYLFIKLLLNYAKP